MKWSDFDRWLQGKHLKGKPATLTIREIVIEEVYQQNKKVRAPVAYFAETSKGFVLSPTNQDKLEALFGDDVTACANQRIVIEPVPMRVGGRDLEVIRIKDRAPVQAPVQTPVQAPVQAPMKSKPEPLSSSPEQQPATPA